MSVVFDSRADLVVSVKETLDHSIWRLDNGT